MGRALGFIGTIVTVAIGMYIYSVQIKTLSPATGGGNSEEVATITGVKNAAANGSERLRPHYADVAAQPLCAAFPVVLEFSD